MSIIQSKAMLATLSISMFSPRKTDKKVTRQVIDQHQAAESAGKFVKQLLPEEALDAIKKLQNEARQYHYEITLPWSDEGARILPSVKYMDYTAKMRGYSRKFEALVDAFLKRYDEFKDAAKTKLNGMYNAEDYPSEDRVRKKFIFKTSFLPFPDSGDFRIDVADEEMATLRSQTDARVLEATETAQRDLWNRLAAPLKMMADRLGDPDAKIYDTVVTNLTDIVKLLPALNITGDKNLESIRQRIEEAKITSINPEVLRKSPSTRRETAGRANAILAAMADYLPADENAPPAAPMEVVDRKEPETTGTMEWPIVPEQPVIVSEIDPIVSPAPEIVAMRNNDISEPQASRSWRRIGSIGTPVLI